MKLQELAERSGVPTASIKYYRRLGLLPAGIKRNSTTSIYRESHLHRLVLISWTRRELGLSLAAVAGLITAIDDPGVSDLYLMGICQQVALGATSGPAVFERDEDLPAAARAARTILDAAPLSGAGTPTALPADADDTTATTSVEKAILAVLSRMGLPDVSASARKRLARAVTDLRAAGYPVDETTIELHLRALLEIAHTNTRPIDGDRSRDEICLEVIRGVTLHNRLLLASSALAHASLSEPSARRPSGGHHGT